MVLNIAGYQTDKYRVRTEVYEGPLDLLLDLIERAELDITCFALAQVTDQYLDYLNIIQNRNPAEISAFLVIASRLVQIKSAALLPKPAISDNISGIEDDPGEALARQLIEYKKFKDTANWLEERDRLGLKTYLRLAPPPKVEAKFDLTGITIFDLISAARHALNYKHMLPSLDTVVNMPRVTIREKISVILKAVQNNTLTKFHSILRNHSKVEIVVSFLALLELVKRQIIEAQQPKIFGEIELTVTGNWTENDVDDLEFID